MAIDKLALKQKAEQLEELLIQYSYDGNVSGLYRAFMPLLDRAKAMQIDEPVEGRDIPGGYLFVEMNIGKDFPGLEQKRAEFSIEATDSKDLLAELGQYLAEIKMKE